MILMYHKVYLESPSKWWVTVNNFYRQMVEISDQEVVYLEDYQTSNENHVVITFDGIYKNVLDYALPILEYFDYPFELFITSDYIGLNNEFDTVEPLAEFTSKEDLFRLIRGKGRLQWHTCSHSNLKNVFDREVLRKELDIPKEILNLDKNGFNWFAYPHGDFNEIVIEEVKKRFEGALSCHQGSNENKYCLNRLTVTNETRLQNRKVACIIASYNYGDYLIESIESVLRQTILPDEILITDDCSDDDTEFIGRRYQEKYPELISFNRNNENLGIVNHFNKAIGLTKSEYVVFLGADNRFQSNYIEETRKVLDKDSRLAIAYTDFALFGTRAKVIYNNFPEKWRGKIKENTFYPIIFPQFSEDKKELIKHRNFIHGSSMFKRRAFDDVGGYVKSEKPEDHNLFMRILKNNWIAAKASNTNLEYRQHSISQANNIAVIQNKMIFYKNVLQKKISFEKSNIYRISYLLYRTSLFINSNYRNPKKIASSVIKKIKSKI